MIVISKNFAEETFGKRGKNRETAKVYSFKDYTHYSKGVIMSLSGQ